MADASFIALSAEIRACHRCEEHLPLGPRPVFQATPQARILIVGQAPGTAVHASGIPFDDPSGDRLRRWLGVEKQTFYDPTQIALIPMGFCYPGKGRGGDLPPRPECAATWRKPLLAHLKHIELTVAIGQYAIAWHIRPPTSESLTGTVARWQEFWPERVVLPHPSPRNTRFLRDRPWIETQLIPRLQERVAQILNP